MPFGAVLAVVVNGMLDAEGLKRRLIEGNGSLEVPDGDEDMIEHECLVALMVGRIHARHLTQRRAEDCSRDGFGVLFPEAMADSLSTTFGMTQQAPCYFVSALMRTQTSSTFARLLKALMRK
jgi:hypothetical protein